MSTAILLLSPELQLRIVDFILEPPSQDDETQDGEKEEYPDRDEQSDSTEHLVPANFKTLIKLSQTCSTFQALLAPSLYKKLHLTNTKRSADSVKAVANGPFRDLVTEILFVGRAPGQNEEGYLDTETVLPEEVEDVLKSLDELFPHLNSLNVGFAFDFSDYNKWDIWAFESFQEEETDEQILDEEKTYGFRALIAKVWTAISSNRRVKNLKMRHFIPKMSSVYSSGSFHAFLGGVQIFEMSVWGSDNGAGWVSSTGVGYLKGLTSLDCIFAALTSCTDFVLEASQYGWYGLEGMNHAPHAFYPGQMPLLRRLTLHHCFISPELKTFLKDHKDTLEEIILQDCAASTNTFAGLAENGINWQEILEALLCMNALKKIEIIPNLGPDSLESHESLIQEMYSEKDRKNPEKRGECEQPDTSRRVFAYGYLNDKYGDYFDDDETQAERYTDGGDQKAWDTLRAMIDGRKDCQGKKQLGRPSGYLVNLA